MMRNWETLVYTAIFITLSGLIWMEVRRLDRHQLGLRIIAVLIAACSLAAIAIRPAFTKKEQLPRPAVFSAPARASGFESAGWSRQLKSGALLSVQGTYRNLAPVPVQLLLAGFGSVVDSMTIAPGHTTRFELKTIPGFLGHAAYTLQTRIEGKIRDEGPVPVEISTNPSLSMLILNDAPSYENKYLNDWLGRNQYQTAMRTRISLHKYHTVLTSGLALSPERLTKSLLNKLDLVVADYASISTLEPAELSALRKAVGDEGLGLIIQLDSSSAASRSSLVPVRVLPVNQGADSLGFLFMDGENHSLQKMPLMPVKLAPQEASRMLVHDRMNHILASLQLLGRGKVVYTVIDQSYTWLLNGNETDYGKLWSLLIEKASRLAVIHEKFTIPVQFPEVDHPLPLFLFSQNSGIPVASTGGAGLAFKQDKLDPGLWSTVCWPRQEGWNSFATERGIPYWFYVFKGHDWADLKALALSKKMKVQNAQSVQAGQAKFTEVKEPVSMTWFWLGFLLSMTYLWVEMKLFPSGLSKP